MKGCWIRKTGNKQKCRLVVLWVHSPDVSGSLQGFHIYAVKENIKKYKLCSVRAQNIRPWLSTQMEEDKTPTKALCLITGDKTKSKVSPQKIHLDQNSFTFQVAWSGLIDGASVKPFVIG